MFGLLPINYWGLSTPGWLCIRTQSKASHHSSTSKDISKRETKQVTAMNSLTTSKAPCFYYITSFWKCQFCSSWQEKGDSLRLPSPMEPFSAVALAQAKALTQGNTEPHTQLNWKSFCASISVDQDKNTSLCPCYNAASCMLANTAMAVTLQSCP